MCDMREDGGPNFLRDSPSLDVGLELGVSSTSAPFKNSSSSFRYLSPVDGSGFTLFCRFTQDLDL